MKEIKLLKAHRHAGRDYPVGTPLKLPPDKADWLIAVGVAEPVKAEKAEPAKAKE